MITIIYVNARALIERNTNNGREIVVQTRNKPGEAPQIELPGGQVKSFESLIAALRREVLEETGLTITAIEGLDTLIEVEHDGDVVECVQPFAVYQTLKGPVDSMGVYFRCQADGQLMVVGDGTKDARWVCVSHIREWMDSGAKQFTWVDRAGLNFYFRAFG